MLCFFHFELVVLPDPGFTCLPNLIWFALCCAYLVIQCTCGLWSTLFLSLSHLPLKHKIILGLYGKRWYWHSYLFHVYSNMVILPIIVDHHVCDRISAFRPWMFFVLVFGEKILFSVHLLNFNFHAEIYWWHWDNYYCYEALLASFLTPPFFFYSCYCFRFELSAHISFHRMLLRNS